MVEDDVDVRLILEHLLIDQGYQVDAIGTAGGGRELLRSHRYDLVVTDGRLPDGTGLDIGDAAINQGIKAIVISGYAFTLPLENRQYEYEILLKPLRPIDIIRAVERALDE